MQTNDDTLGPPRSSSYTLKIILSITWELNSRYNNAVRSQIVSVCDASRFPALRRPNRNDGCCTDRFGSVSDGQIRDPSSSSGSQYDGRRNKNGLLIHNAQGMESEWLNRYL